MILDSQAFADALEEDRDNKTARQGKPKKKHDSQKMKVSTKKQVRFDDT
jgi:hypothetical protein